ncbi:MAG: rod shape-determining protein MreC [Clostridiales bacterium]|nr:rod shape-determining protein MreC [Clostridiales bacterium]
MRFFKSKFFILFLVLLVIVAGMGIYSRVSAGSASPLHDIVNTILTPFRSLFTNAADTAESLRDYVSGYDELKAENEDLKAKLREAEAKIHQAEQVLEENRRLREQYNMQERNISYDLVSAEVIGVESGSWGATYTLDRGSRSGINVGDCVITSDGVVGFVTAVGTVWCEMETIISADTKAGAMVSETRDIGVAEGDFSLMREGVLKLSYLPKDNEIAIGNRVETSGLGGVYPKGLILGKVVSLGIEDHGISAYAIIEPAVNLNKLGLVYVIRDFESVE